MKNEFGDNDLFSEFVNGDTSNTNELNKNSNCEIVEDLKFLKKRIEYLERKNAELERLASIFKFEKNENNPAFQILYYDDKYSRIYKDAIENFVHDLIARPINGNHLPLLSNRPNFIKLREKSENEARIMVIGSCKYYNEMVIDKLGWPLNGDDVNTSYSWNIPRFVQSFNCAYPEPNFIEDEFKLPQRPKSVMNCFNCNGPHSVQKCPEKKDFQRISYNRNKFNNEREASTQHQNNNWGFATDRKNPSSPPIGIYNDTTKDEFLEDGELRDQAPPYSKLPNQNFSKFFPPPNNCHPFMPPRFPCQDPNYINNVPSNYNYQFPIQHMAHSRNTQAPVSHSMRKRSAEVSADVPLGKQIKLETAADMDIDESDIVCGEIKEFEALTPLHTSRISLDNDSISIECSEKSHISHSKSFDLGTPIALDLSTEEDLVTYAALPEPSKFSIGISDHINFENIPGATGAYERMKKLFKMFKK